MEPIISRYHDSHNRHENSARCRVTGDLCEKSRYETNNGNHEPRVKVTQYGELLAYPLREAGDLHRDDNISM